jgi:hypothetical protein
MRTILLGSDFTQNKQGNLVPVEINTAVTFDGNNYLENFEDIFDFTDLISFIQDRNFTKVHYIGEMSKEFGVVLEAQLNNIGVEYEHHKVGGDSITVPYIEDTNDILIIRSAYDTTAIVDEEYCKNKVGFMNLIKDSSFGSQFAYMDENNSIVNNITTIIDNGVHPNFILKAVLPHYDQDQYPKLFKVTTIEELNQLVSSVVNKDYFLMDYHLNTDSLYQNHVTIIRSLNLLFPPDLESIKLGAYTKLSQFEIPSTPTFNETTFEIDNQFKYAYIVGKKQFGALPKLEDDDLVELSDGSFKSALDLQVGDMLKTIDIDMNGQEYNPSDEQENFNITFDQLVTGSTYSTNEVLNKVKVSALSEKVYLTFTDGSDWNDTAPSSYLSIRNNEVRFIYLKEIVAGDQIILVNSENNELQYVTKEVATVSVVKEFFDGWYITVSRTHFFLTKTGSDTNTSYATIEHNIGCQSKYCPPYQPGYVNGCCPGGQCCQSSPPNICGYYCT